MTSIAESLPDRAFERRVADFIDRQTLVRPGDHGVVAFSGGGDSLCLLAILARLASTQGVCLTAVHVDHGLRDEAMFEAQAAVSLADALDVCIRVVGVNIQRSGNLQARAREARLRALFEVADEVGASWIATGHQADDQAETVVMRLLRGAGPSGLAGMAAKRGRIIRPLLTTTRAEIDAYLAFRGLQPVEDPSNESDSYLRNRVRHHLLPALAKENPRIRAALARLADSCRADDACLRAQAAQVLVAAATERDSVTRRFEAAPLAALPPALLRRAIRGAYRDLVATSDASDAPLELTHEHALVVADGVRAGHLALDVPSARITVSSGIVSFRRKIGRKLATVADLRGD